METKLGLRENWQQFSLLVLVNAFVGGMVGLERALLPQIAEVEFGIAAKSVIFSFIVVFGIVKAITNYFTGELANKVGRKNLLLIGWLVGTPVPFILMFAQSWHYIILANILLGINQGLAWSATVIMKIDLVGDKNRGFAMGINEFAGYVAVALVAWYTSYIAAQYGLRPYPFMIGIAFPVLGIFLTLFFIKDTQAHVLKEAAIGLQSKLKNVFWETTWLDKNLGSVTQAGLINNLNDGMAWGLFPVLLASRGFSLEQIGIVTGIYPAVWGIAQLFTGKLSDLVCKKTILFWGMFLQGLVLVLLIWAGSFEHFILLSSLLGLGTAMVYPTFLATIAQYSYPAQRAKSLGIFRFWRDMGYAIGAILTGVIADLLGVNASLICIGLLTLLSAFIIHYRMHCKEERVTLTTSIA